jgi:hypothetical protein
MTPSGNTCIPAFGQELSGWWSASDDDIESSRSDLIEVLQSRTSNGSEILDAYMAHQNALDVYGRALSGDDQERHTVWSTLSLASCYYNAGYRHQALLLMLDAARTADQYGFQVLVKDIAAVLTEQFDGSALELEVSTRILYRDHGTNTFIQAEQLYNRLRRAIPLTDSVWQGRLYLGHASVLAQMIQAGYNSAQIRTSLKWSLTYAESFLRETPEHIEAIKLKAGIFLPDM